MAVASREIRGRSAVGNYQEILLEGLGPRAETVPRRRSFETDSPRTLLIY